jgi:nucleotide-binding universal stress UspA family protein
MTPTNQRTSADVPEQSGRVVVGVDGSQGSLNALRWALGEARARKIPVHAVFAWNYRPSWVDPGLGTMFPLGYQPEGSVPEDEFATTTASVEKLLDAAISKVTESDPDRASGQFPVTRATLQGHAAHALLTSAGETDTLVVGSHGHGGFIGAVLGSVSQHVVSHSRCPVVVVPATQRTPKG